MTRDTLPGADAIFGAAVLLTFSDHGELHPLDLEAVAALMSRLTPVAAQ
jgi:hypothetical protein